MSLKQSKDFRDACRNKVAVVLPMKLNLNCPIKKTFISVSCVVQSEIKYSKEICNVDVK